MNEEFNMLYHRIIRLAWILLIIVSAIFAIVSVIFFPDLLWYKLSISYVMGAMTSIFAFNLLKNNVSNLSSDQRQAISGGASNYVGRLVIYGFVLAFSFKFAGPRLDPYAVAIGFFTVKAAIYLNNLLKRK